MIGWDAALRALDAGLMPCAPSEQAILRIAASPGDPEIPVRLRTVPGNLDTRNISLVTDAITAANGCPITASAAAWPPERLPHPCWPLSDLPAAPDPLTLLTS